MPRPALCLCLLALLAGCAAPPVAERSWAAPSAVREHAGEVLCRLSEHCDDFRWRWLDHDDAQAELRFGFELVISRGFYRRLDNEAELAFVLAHELAHRFLNHRGVRDPAVRLPLELAADRWAADRLCAQGWSSAHASAFIERLLGEAATAAESRRQRLSLQELQARRDALQPCAGADYLLLDGARFARLRAAATP